jgi:phosphate-selective porin OprO and OprP
VTALGGTVIPGGGMTRHRAIVAAGGALLALTLAAAEDATPETSTDASKGFVTFKSGDNSLTLGAWGLFRATADDRDRYDADTSGSGVGKPDGTAVAFAVVKLRTYLQGNVWKPWLKYKFEFELGPLPTSATTNVGNSRLTDAYVEFAKVPAAAIRIGQYKVPFGLQELTSDTKQEFPDRSIVDAKFAPGRDIGVMLSGHVWDDRFGYQAAVFNGAGQNNPQEDQGVLYAARIWIDPFGEYKLEEAAVSHPEARVIHFGLAYRAGEVPKGSATAGVVQDPDLETAAALEIAWRWRRLFAMGEYFGQKDAPRNPAPGPDIKARGWHAQFGAFVVPKRHELAVRYAAVDPDTSVVNARQTETRLVYGFYMRGHNLKLQADVGQVRFGGNFASLSSLAIRNVSPGLEAARRLAILPGTALSDRQARVQVTVAF